MTFDHRPLLLLLWVVPLLALLFSFGAHRRRVLLTRWADPGSLTAQAPPGLAGRRRARAVLVPAAAALLIVALAGPRYGVQWQRIESEGVDLVIALDCSRSMLAQDTQPTRLERSKREIRDLLAMLQGDRAGLVAFSGTAFLQCPLTIDYAAFGLFLSVLTPDDLPVGGTDLGAAVQTAISAFDPDSTADKAILLISDGENTGAGDPLQAAAAAAKAGIHLYCIGVGATDGAPVPADRGGFAKDGDGRIVMSRLDDATLSAMALATGGVYVRSVAGDMDLEVIYRDHIRKKLQTAAAQSGRKQVRAERFQWPLALAVILLAVALARPLAARAVMIVCALWLGLAAHGPAWAGPLQAAARSYAQGDYPEALRQMIAGQLEHPDDPRVVCNLGNAYYKIGDFEAARRHYLQALAAEPAGGAGTDPGWARQFRSRLLYNLGNTAYRRGELEEAVAKYTAALALTPDDWQAAQNLEFVQRQLQNRPRPPQRDAPSGEPKPQSGFGAAGGPTGAGPTPLAAEPAQEGSFEMGERVQDPNAVAGPQMLNRLKDETGRALMPRYQKRRVEKDW